MTHWNNCKKILCVRPDNMGDLLMSAPAIAALKETFGCAITLLTSSMAGGIAPYIPGVDEVMTWDVPWVKGTSASGPEAFNEVIQAIKQKNFDGAVIFTVFSQNPLPAALMVTLAGIPYRAAYCRENPYHLLSHWIPDKEPYEFIRHQVRRDLDLVRHIGANKGDEWTGLHVHGYDHQVREKLSQAGVDQKKPWLIIHPGVSEEKRRYPSALWIEAGKMLVNDLGHQVIITGAPSERGIAGNISEGIGDGAFNLAGTLVLEEFITLIRFAPLLISVNTGSVHLAAAMHKKVLVLYALTNPQHPPWKTVGKILPFSIPVEAQSRNEVLQFVNKKYFASQWMDVTPEDIYRSAYHLLMSNDEPQIDELVLPSTSQKIME